MDKKTFLILASITALAFVVRLMVNPGAPPGFSENEATLGLGAHWLIRGRAIFDGSSWLGVILTLPSVAIFGLNELAVRLPPIILGTLTVPLLYFLSRELSPNAKKFTNHPSASLGINRSLFTVHPIAFLSALLLALSPWHLQLSRAFLPATSAIFFLILGLWLILAKEKKRLFLGFFSLFFSLASHPASWPFVLPLAAFVFWSQRLRILRQRSYLAIFVIASLLLFVTQASALADFYIDTSFFRDPGFVNRINQLRGYHIRAGLSTLGLILYNKPVNFAEMVIRNYIASFDWYYLFTHSFWEETFFVWRFGKFSFVALPFFIAGLVAILRKRPSFSWLLLIWIALAPLPGVLRDSPDFPQTLFFLIPVFLLVAAFGFFFVFDLLSHWKLLAQALVGLSVLVYGLNFTTFFHYYLVHYPSQSFRDWRFGYQQAVPVIQEMSEGFDKVIFTDRLGGDPKTFYLFYTRLSPAAAQLTKFEFRSINWEEEDRLPGTLFVGTAEDIPEDYRRPPIIFYPDGSPALFFVGVPKK